MLATRVKPLEAGVLLVPFVDVLLVLVVFALLVNGLFFGPAVGIDLSPAGFAATPAAAHTLLVTHSGALFLDGRRVDPEGLQFGLGLLREGAKEPSLIVRAESGVESGRLFELLSTARECGFGGVSVGLWEEK